MVLTGVVLYYTVRYGAILYPCFINLNLKGNWRKLKFQGQMLGVKKFPRPGIPQFPRFVIRATQNACIVRRDVDTYDNTCVSRQRSDQAVRVTA